MTVIQASIALYFSAGFILSTATLALAYTKHDTYIVSAAVWEKILAIVVMTVIWPWGVYAFIRAIIKGDKP